jgi:serine/threonine protein kinase
MHAQVYLTSTFAVSGKKRARQMIKASKTGKSPFHRAHLTMKALHAEPMCDHEATEQMGSSMAALIASNASEEQILKASQDYVRTVVAHEIGHTLGLRHNFAGSLSPKNFPLDKKKEIFGKYLHTSEVAEEVVPSSSVMDYLQFEEDSIVGRKIALNQPMLGYDKRAIETLYLGKEYKKGLNIVGITMKYLPQDYFPLDVIFNKSYCLKHNINDAVKNKITKNLIDAINSAHNMNVEIGDLSGLNVMINNYGDVKLIDVDSYQVPGVKHSNKLLEDIRDYLYGGTVSKNSDYFSLSVLIFNYLTYLHPFKGIHKKISKLSERMIAKKPVFASDPDLIIPKCYEKIQNVFIQNQYEKLYINGDRFLLDFSNNVKTPVVSTIKQKVISEKEVYIQNIYTSQKIIQNSYFNLKFGFIKNEEKFIFYDTSNKGMIIERSSFAANEWKDFFVGEDNVVGLKNQSLYKIDILTGKSEEIKNFVLTNGYRYTHSNNLIILFENEYMWNLNIDSIKYNNIMIEKNNIYGPGFKTYGGIIQNVGGLNYIHLNIKNKQVPFLSRVNVHSFISINDVGFIKYEENKKIIYKYFNTDGGKLNIIKETDEVLHFAYKGKNNKDAILFSPEKCLQILIDENIVELDVNLALAFISNLDEAGINIYFDRTGNRNDETNFFYDLFSELEDSMIKSFFIKNPELYTYILQMFKREKDKSEIHQKKFENFVEKFKVDLEIIDLTLDIKEKVLQKFDLEKEKSVPCSQRNLSRLVGIINALKGNKNASDIVQILYRQKTIIDREEKELIRSILTDEYMRNMINISENVKL